MEKGEWLTDRERVILSLYFKRGWHIEAIAAELDVSRSTIDRELKKIREMTLN